MENELQAKTEAGQELVASAGWFAAMFAEDAAQYDKAGSFPFAHLDALKGAGFLYSPAPVEAGGMGIESVHDLMVASSRLARGDASLTLGVNMHLLVFQAFARQRRIAINRGDEARASGLTAVLGALGAGKAFIASAVSEVGQDLLRPASRVTNDGAGWRLNGRKIISSGSPAATHFSVAVTVGEGADARYAYAMVPRQSPGVTVLDDWDGLGMRASGSCSVVFENVELPDFNGDKGSPAGVITAEHLEKLFAAGPAHAGASLGVAEAAHQAAISSVCKKRRHSPGTPIRAFVQERAAENSVDLAAARAVFARSLTMIDEYNEAHPCSHGTLAEASAVFSEVQRAKVFINSAAVRIADRSIAMAGGSGFANTSPLARCYRDARAGAFMHPLGHNVALEYLGAHTLGLNPETF